MRILLAGNSSLFRQGLRTLLEAQPDIEILGDVAGNWEAINETRRLEPDLLIIDIDSSQASDLEYVDRIRKAAPVTRVLIFTDSEREEDLWQALRRGVHGYLLKNCESEELFRAVASVSKGKLAISSLVGGRAILGLALRREETTSTRERLTMREKEVLRLLRDGNNNYDIGRQLSLSVSTVGHHVHNILRKLRVNNRVQAATMVTTDESYLDGDQDDSHWTSQGLARGATSFS